MKRRSIKEHVGAAMGPGFASWDGGDNAVTKGKFSGLGKAVDEANMKLENITDEQLQTIVREEMDNMKLINKWEVSGLFKHLKLFESKLRAAKFLEEGMARVIKLFQENKLTQDQARKLSEMVIVESKPLLRESE